MTKILLIEDDVTLRGELADALAFHGFTVLQMDDGTAAVQTTVVGQPDLILLDIMLPGASGFEVCRQLRQGGSQIPVIVLTARGSEHDKLLGFEVGADDYVTKPFSLPELVARIQAVLKRTRPNRESSAALPTGRMAIGDAVANFDAFTITRGGRTWTCTAREMGVLQLLARVPDRVHSREEIIETVWGTDVFVTTRTVDNFILKLRARVESDPSRPTHLITVHGAGYKLVP